MSEEVRTTETDSANADVFELVYQGPEVEDGTMSARQLVEVVTGLQKAFTTVAQDRDLSDRYELRIKDINHASVHLVFEAVGYAKANPPGAAVLVAAAGVGVNAITNVVQGIYRVVMDLASTIEAKRKAKGEPIARMSATFSDGDVQLLTPDGSIALSKEQYELLLSKRLDRSLSQIVSPLQHGKVNSFQIRREDRDLVNVNASERDYFDYVEVVEERTREGTEIDGTLNSLTKSNLRGTFYTTDGVHVPYRYTGGDLQQLFSGFSSRESVRVKGRVKYGSDGIPTYVEVEDIEPLQRSFPTNIKVVTRRDDQRLG